MRNKQRDKQIRVGQRGVCVLCVYATDNKNAHNFALAFDAQSFLQINLSTIPQGDGVGSWAARAWAWQRARETRVAGAASLYMPNTN